MYDAANDGQQRLDMKWVSLRSGLLFFYVVCACMFRVQCETEKALDMRCKPVGQPWVIIRNMEIGS